MKGRYLGKDIGSPEAHDMWACPYCGKVTYQGRWTGTGVIEDVAGCQHWTGTGDIEEYFEGEALKTDCREVVVDLSTFYTSRAKFSKISLYRQKAIDLAGNGKEVVLTGAAPVWLYLNIANELHGKVKSLIYRSPVTGDAVIGDYAPEGTAY